jgi:phosphatidate cytidylyltransferase
MLKTRVITAIVLAPLAFALIFMTEPAWFGLIFAVLLMIGSWEFRRLGGLDRGVVGWLMLLVQAVIFALLLSNSNVVHEHAHALLTAACLVWLLMFIRLVLYRPDAPMDFQYRIISFASSVAALTFTWIALYFLRGQAGGPWWILLLMLIIWSADTGAYFAGRAWGKKKLAPAISPSKTITGVFGGMLTAVAVSLLAVWLIPSIEAEIHKLIPLVLVTAVISVAGDLFISLHKRKSGHKDSGSIFPGHGGILDRFDSLLAGAPFFALGLLLLGPG